MRVRPYQAIASVAGLGPTAQARARGKYHSPERECWSTT
jgi:hypothetical protein